MVECAVSIIDGGTQCARHSKQLHTLMTVKMCVAAVDLSPVEINIVGFSCLASAPMLSR